MRFSHSIVPSLVILADTLLCTSAWLPHAPSRVSSSSVFAGRASLNTRTALAATVEESAAPSTAAAASSSDLGLLPEFEAARQYTRSQFLAAIPAGMEEKMQGMIPLLNHFIDEYITSAQNAYVSRGKQPDDFCTPAAATKRILSGFSYAFNYGMGPNRFIFDVSHEALRGKNPELENGNTIDFYTAGCDFFRQCMDLSKSQVLGRDNIDRAMAQLAAGDNVVLLANHQTEADPQVVSVCLELCGYGHQAEEMVYVAGHKVTTDPLAIPFSMGRNLICIHSKKHMSDGDSEQKKLKQKQNLKAMSAMLNKFKAGGCLLWVAPSGGRDRRDVETNTVPLAPFDSKTIDMFRLIGNKSGVTTHYYTLAMSTYNLCPPPDYICPGVGEERNFRFVPVGIHVGHELKNEGGLESRQEFCRQAFAQCQHDYEALLQALQAAQN